MIKTRYIILLAVLALTSCRDDSILTTVTETETPPVEDIYINNMHGLVIDDELQPVAQAKIEVSGYTTTTDDQGVWALEDVTINRALGTYVAVEAEDHYAGGTRVYTNNATTAQVITKLVAYTTPSIFDSGSPAVVTTDRASIDFTGAAFVSEDGSHYTGGVSVHSYHLDPSDIDFLERSPGDLSATNNDGERIGLQSYGMLAVELIGASGQHLQLADGSNATISLEIPTELQNSAPATIPLWSYDEVLGLWIEEGSATLQGNTYVGQVEHFSWWNCDIEIDPITLCIEISQPETGNALEGITMVLCDDLLGSATGTTDARGSLCGIVPSDRVITLKILNACDDVVHMETIGPFSDDSDIVVDYTPDVNSTALVEGAISTCDPGIDLSDMIVSIITEYDRSLASLDGQGNYTKTIHLCDNSVDYDVSAISISNQLSGYGTGTATAAGPNLVDIDICDDLPLLVLYDDNGVVLYSTNEVTLAVKPNETLINVEDGVVGWSGNTVGTYPANAIFQLGIQGDKAGGTEVTISTWGPVGSMVSGTINGVNNFTLSQIGNYTGEFTARRTE